jgi:hypothetical protein
VQVMGKSRKRQAAGREIYASPVVAMSGFTLACVLFSIALRRLSPYMGKRGFQVANPHGFAGRGGKTFKQ